MKRFFIIPLAFLMSFAVANAQAAEPSAGILPGSALSFLDVISEGLGNAFAFGKIAKAERYFAQANERLAEARALADQGDTERAEQAVRNYEERLAAALARAEEAKDKSDNDDEANDVLTRIAEATFKHQEVLMEVFAKVPEQARDGIQNAIDNSVRGHDSALEAIAKERATGSQKPADAGRPE
jgi:hypothetical protein